MEQTRKRREEEREGQKLACFGKLTFVSLTVDGEKRQ